MTKTNDYIKEENLQAYRDRLSEKAAAFAEECTALKPEAGVFFKEIADNVISSTCYTCHPEIINYIKLDDLKNYLLEYYDNFYDVNTQRNEYVFTLMELGEKYKSEDDVPEEIREDLDKMNRESNGALRKYNINGLYKRILDMLNKAYGLYLADEIKQESQAFEEMVNSFTDDIDREINRLSGSLQDMVFELRRLLHEVDKGREKLEEVCH